MKTKRTLAIATGKMFRNLTRAATGLNGRKVSAALLIVAIATLITMTSSRSSATPSGSSAPQLEGSWEVTVMPTGGDPVVDYATFMKGGGMIGTDPDPNVSTGVGTWEKTGGN